VMIATVPEAIPIPLATPHPCTWQTTGSAEDCPLPGRAEVTGAGGRLPVWRHPGVAVPTTAAPPRTMALLLAWTAPWTLS